MSGAGAGASRRPLAVSVGDPAGVGPEVSLRAVAPLWDEAVVLFGDAAWLADRAPGLGIDRRRLREVDPTGELDLAPGDIGLAPCVTWESATVAARTATAEGGRAQLTALDAAIDAARTGRARAVVTAPTSKAAITAGGVPFTGQTERLAAAAGIAEDGVTMMFLGPRLRVALVTTHLALADAPAAVTGARVERAVVHLAEALDRLRERDTPPRIVVAGLNPHAGEGGLFGQEEIRVIAPALESAIRREPFTSRRVHSAGLLPAETAFRQAAAGTVDGVVAMVHDQATIASKLLDWGAAVNVTWGLPFVRTSVDHGVAYDAAAAGTASAEGMIAAVNMARRLTAGRPEEAAG